MPQPPSPREIELSPELACATAQLGKASSELAELRREIKLLHKFLRQFKYYLSW